MGRLNAPAVWDARPIVACATGMAQNTALALIRLSGFGELGEVAKFFAAPMGAALKLKPRRAVFCHLLEGSRVIDQVVVTYFAGPASFTGENLLEISVHGNLVNIERVLDLFTASGTARLALPGEFSFRALKNQKISLPEAEGLDLFLHASSKGVLDQGAKLMGGALSRAYLELRESFVRLRAALELALDFLPDVGEVAAQESFVQAMQDFSARLGALERRSRGSLREITAPDMVIVGRPNAGKSTLFNRLLHEARSIVSSEAGTTRDYVSESVSWGGIEFRLIDTAGIRKTSHGVERQGVERSVALARSAFFSILLVDPAGAQAGELGALAGIPFDLLLWSHMDQPPAQEWPSSLQGLRWHHYGHVALLEGEPRGEVVLREGPLQWPPAPLGPQGLGAIGEMVAQKYRKLLARDEILVPRQRALIRQCWERFGQFRRVVENERDMAIVGVGGPGGGGGGGGVDWFDQHG